jgi:hypothetical protein
VYVLANVSQRRNEDVDRFAEVRRARAASESDPLVLLWR